MQTILLLHVSHCAWRSLDPRAHEPSELRSEGLESRNEKGKRKSAGSKKRIEATATGRSFQQRNSSKRLQMKR